MNTFVRSRENEHGADAPALGAEEGRAGCEKPSVSAEKLMIEGCPNGETRQREICHSLREGTRPTETSQ